MRRDDPLVQALRRPSRVRRDLRANLAEGGAWGLMVGSGEAYLAAFALAIGLGEVVAGLAATVPMLLGAVLQIGAPVAIGRVASLRRWVMAFAAVQAMALLAYSVAALTGGMDAVSLFTVATVYWAAGLTTGPAWSTWMETVVPRRVRARFFALRNRLSQIGVLIGLAGGGIALQLGEARGHGLTVFAGLFAVAAAARAASALMFARQRESDPLPAAYRVIPFGEMVGRVFRGPDGRLLRYMLAMQFAVQVSGPYFTPFMLGRLELNYASYLTLIATSFVTKFLTLPLVGRYAHRIGAKSLLWIGGVGVIPLALLWSFGDSVPYLIGVQMLSGLMWGMYELGTFLLLFDHIRANERTSMMAFFNFANAVMMVVGSLLGGLVIHWFGESRTGYLVVFGLSTCLRLPTLLFLKSVVETAHRPWPFTVKGVAVRILAVRPQFGSIDRPLVELEEPEASSNGRSGSESPEDEPAGLSLAGARQGA